MLLEILSYSIGADFMTEEEKKMMDQYGITSQQKTVYLYNGHKYDNLKDAISYAKTDTQRK